MSDLLQLALDAHGGVDQWNQFDKVAVHMLVDGVLWDLKGQAGVLSDSRIEVGLHKQCGRYIDFENREGWETDFMPDRVAIVDKDAVVQELFDPRKSFASHQLHTPWTRLQMIYFGSYAMWEYLTIPFNLTLPGFEWKEITPWHEGGETWRRMQVTFPDGWAYHSKEQVFYFDKNGLLKRLDYEVEISANTPAAQYVFDYREIQGIKLPTRRLVYGRDEHGHYSPIPLVVGIELLDVQFR
jgi:hypothetical protein